MNLKTIKEPPKEIPVISETDVLVVGSGMAGAAAAIAAARNGAKVSLIEKENCPGGLATLGLVWVYLPLCDGRGNKLIGGLGEELLKASLKYGPGRISRKWKASPDSNPGTRKRYLTVFNPASFIISMEEMLNENGVEIYYDTRFCNVIKEGNRISAVIVENKSGRSAILAKTVVDATGDADVCQMSGEDTISLDDNRLSSWFYSYDKKKLRRHILIDPLEGEIPEGSRTFAGDDHWDVTNFNILARKKILGKIKEMKKSNRDVYPVILPGLPGFRMTRRLNGKYILTGEDKWRYFDDTIGMIGEWRRAGCIYCIPYSSLVASRTANLIAAGRCISAADDAWKNTRAIGPCALTGEAAGTAAALSSKEGSDLHSLDIRVLQDKLRSQEVIIDKDLIERSRKSYLE